MNVILVDSGTTNSRLRLVDLNNSKITDSEKIQIGVRNTAMEGNNERLKKHLRIGIQALLNRNELIPTDIKYIAASGMITSNLGIYEIPHIHSPASLEDFVNHSKVIILEEFFNIPCLFIPGMKNNVTTDTPSTITNINNFDVMRGEEVEAIGLLKQMNVKGKGILVLPGSHTKYVIVDKDGTLLSCISTLGGETLLALQRETILSDSIKPSLIEDLDKNLLEQGFQAAKRYGLTRSFYHVRLLHLFSSLDANQRANYFVGSVIHDDIQALLKTVPNIEEIEWVIVGGTNPLRGVFAHLLQYLGNDWEIFEANDTQVEYSLVYGAQEIALKSVQGICIQ